MLLTKKKIEELTTELLDEILEWNFLSPNLYKIDIVGLVEACNNYIISMTHVNKLSKRKKNLVVMSIYNYLMSLNRYRN